MRKSIKHIAILLIILLCSSPSFAGHKALLIGVQNYIHLDDPCKPRMCDLKGPINDVKAFKEALISYHGFKENDIKTLLDKDATRNAIDEAFHEWLVDRTNEGDLAIFYFSGHGSYIPNLNPSEKERRDQVLLPVNMEPDTGYYIIIDDEIEMWLEELAGRTVVVIIDSCFAEGQVRDPKADNEKIDKMSNWQKKFIPLTPSFKTLKPSEPANDVMHTKKFQTEGFTICMFASGEYEPAWEIDLQEDFYGGFTFALCEAMKDPNASYEELIEYSKKIMKSKLHLEQVPKIKGETEMIKKTAFK